MSINWDLYNARLNLHGNTQKDRIIKEFQTIKENKAMTNPSCKTVIIEGISKQVLIDSKTDKNKFLMSPVNHSDTILLGNKVVWNNINFLVTELSIDNDVYVNSTIQQCNYTLPFQLGTSTIIQEPCIVSDSQSTIGEDQNNVMTVPDAFRHILVQYNTNTSKLVKGKRIFIDRVCDNPSVYEITKVDRIVHMDGDNGLLYLTCNEGQTIDKDRKDLLIADYISSSTPTPSPTPTSSGSCTITMNNGTAYTTVQNIRIGGTGNYFNALFKDTNGNVLTNLTPTWTLTDLNGITNSDIIMSTVDGYPLRIKVKIAYKTTLIGSSFKIHLIDSGNTLSSYDVSCKVVSL